MGDCSGFASGTMVMVSLRDSASGFTFSGSGPGELGGELGGSVYMKVWGDMGDIWVSRCWS
jgi:hypothetical protein